MTMLVNDILYGSFPLNGVYEELVSSPAFQRIEGINTFAFPDLNFHGVHHTEYDHALGVFHLMETILDKVLAVSMPKSLYDQYAEALKLSALLHYSISRPFEEQSQAAELELGIDLEEKRFHAFYTQTPVGRILEQYQFESVFEKALTINLGRPGIPKAIDALFNSIIGIKKLDYLPRDIRYAGMEDEITPFDVERFCQTMDFSDPDRLTLQMEDRSLLYDFFENYHYMFAEVYLQHRKSIMENMYETVYKAMIREGLLNLEQDLISACGALPVFFQLNDQNALGYYAAVLKESGSFAGKVELQELLDRIIHRDEYTTVVRWPLPNEHRLTAEERERLQDALADGLGVPEKYQILVANKASQMAYQVDKPCNQSVYVDDCPLFELDDETIRDYFSDWETMQYLDVCVVPTLRNQCRNLRKRIEDVLRSYFGPEPPQT